MRNDTGELRRVGRRSVLWGLGGATAMAGFYVAVVAGASGSWTHLTDQLGADWYLLVPVISGFGIQVGLLTELRRRHRLHALAATAGGTGATTSAAGMIACCAHHIADLLPFLGLSGAATFLYDYKVAFVAVGIIVNAIGIAIAAKRLHETPMPQRWRNIAGSQLGVGRQVAAHAPAFSPHYLTTKKAGVPR